MKGSTSLLIVVVGLLVLWLGVTGKFDCFAGALTCILKGAPGAATATPEAAPGTVKPGGSSALGRVAAKLGALDSNETLSLEYWLRGAGGTPPFAG